jgi:hypothetical protein
LIHVAERPRWREPVDACIDRRVSTSIKEHMSPRSSSDAVEPHSRRSTVRIAQERHVTAEPGSAIG